MGCRPKAVAFGQGMNAPLGESCAAAGVTGRPHARGIPWRYSHAAGQPSWPAPGQTGGGQKSRATPGVKPPPLSFAGFFSAERFSGRLGSDGGHGQAERGHPSCWGIRPPKGRAASRPRPCQPDPGAIAGRVCDLVPGPDFRRIIFPFNGRLSGSYVLQGNNGNMGTSSIKQAESLAVEGCQPVPKPSGRFGNMGTEMSDPDAGKSARVWPPHARASR